MKKISYIFGIVLLAAFFNMAITGCDDTTDAETITLKATGKLPILFDWNDNILTCPECVEIRAIVSTAEHGDFKYGPFDFAFNGFTIKAVLSGFNREVTVWVTDADGDIIYRGVVEGVRVTADKMNNPAAVEMFSRGWYEEVVTQPSANWALECVRMTDEGKGWIAGMDLAGSSGAIFKAVNSVWTPKSVSSVASANWLLNSIDDGSAWAAGEDIANNAGIILRYDGAIWQDDVAEPVIADPWRLYGVSFDATGVGWAVGETDIGASHEPVVLNYSAAVWAEIAVPPGSTSLYDVFAIGDDALMGGVDNTSGNGVLIAWDAASTTYTDFAPAVSVANAWEVRDVYALSSDDWWAAGISHGANDNGMVIHYTLAGGVVTEYPAGPVGNWALEGIWADATGEAWAVGYGDNDPVVLHRDTAGVWTSVDPDLAATTWRLYSVDLDPEGWGFAVGEDTGTNQGLVLKYPFPK